MTTQWLRVGLQVAIKNIAAYAINTPARGIFGIIFAVLMTGCATGPNANPRDPLEPFNRAMFSVNETLDKAIVKPVAQGYQAVTPSLVRAGVGNFFSNLGDVWTTVNAVLQLRGQKAVESVMRLSVNTVFGLGGIFDVATEAGMPKHREDFGQTLGRWGMPSGPYVVLPFFGPSTVRDTAALPVDSQGNPISYVTPAKDSLALTALSTVNFRASLFKQEELFNQVAIDRYVFIRDAFMQKRRNDVFDGEVPDDDKEPSAEAAEDDKKPPAGPASPAPKP